MNLESGTSSLLDLPLGGNLFSFLVVEINSYYKEIQLKILILLILNLLRN